MMIRRSECGWFEAIQKSWRLTKALSSFAKLSYIFNFFEDFNGRIRETALIVAMDLWRFDELKADIQAI